MKVDIPVEEYQKYLQHRKPMVWIDRVVEAGMNDKGIFGACKVVVEEGQLFLTEGGQIRGTSAVEFVAQAYGFVRACYQRENDIPYIAKRTFLTGIRSCQAQFGDRKFSEGEELHIEIQTARELHPLFFIRGQVFNADKSQEYAHVEVQLYIGD